MMCFKVRATFAAALFLSVGGACVPELVKGTCAEAQSMPFAHEQSVTTVADHSMMQMKLPPTSNATHRTPDQYLGDPTPSPTPEYFLINSGMDWATAEQACVAQGGHLASIASQAENALVAEVCSTSVCTGVCSGGSVAVMCWIGGRKPADDLSSGVFTWSDGTSPSFTNPCTLLGGQFQNVPDQPFLAMYNPASTYKYNEPGKWQFEGHGSYPSVCERRASAAPTPAPATEASAEDDPHVASMAGEKFTIGTPSMYTLIRVPKNEEDPAFFQLVANFSEEPHVPCKLYIKSIELAGKFMQGSVAQVLPLARDKTGSNTAGSTTQRPFTLVVQSGGTSSSTPWDRAAQEWVAGHELSPQVSVRATVKDELTRLQEGHQFDFAIDSTVHVIIQQASHQALNIKLTGISSLGVAEIGGLLGTSKHSRDVETPTQRCLASRVVPSGSL